MRAINYKCQYFTSVPNFFLDYQILIAYGYVTALIIL